MAEVLKPNDILFILTVAESIASHYDMASTYLYEQYLIAQNEIKKNAKKLLVSFNERAKSLGIKNHTLLLTTASHTGEAIVKAAELKQVDFLYIGSRGLGLIKRLLLGSVSKYVVENASCNVVVVKQRVAPAEIHESSREAIREAEEKERLRRIEEDKEIDRVASYHSRLDKHLVVMAEEEERWRRIHEEESREQKEKQEREAAKIGAVVEEERERQRRIKESGLDLNMWEFSG
eukprot:TRINITY_DN1374_c0_g1_i1.p1 TRINITY_DN1374_c0_g1~~TRINITY_DN1374_c0_g1_i1.p1  ORF type:complete len:266 (-),score=80.67 TRINITY_DN1374_c0_g1_i1:52-753(-)